MGGGGVGQNSPKFGLRNLGKTHKSERAALLRVQKLALFGISEVMGSTPTAAVEVALGFAPLHICAQQEALCAAYRLRVAGL